VDGFFVSLYFSRNPPFFFFFWGLVSMTRSRSVAFLQSPPEARRRMRGRCEFPCFVFLSRPRWHQRFFRAVRPSLLHIALFFVSREGRSTRGLGFLYMQKDQVLRQLVRKTSTSRPRRGKAGQEQKASTVSEKTAKENYEKQEEP